MLLVDIYKYILLLVATIGTLVLTKKYKVATFNRASVESKAADPVSVVLCLFFAILIGLRPMEGGMGWIWGDSYNYYGGYLMQEGIASEWKFSFNEPIWGLLFNFVTANSLGINTLFLICDLLYFGCTYLACRKWFPHDTTVAFLVFLGAFSTYSYSYNGVRAGVAGAIFLLGLAYYDRKGLSIALILISWGFHHSMQMPVAAYVLTLLYKEPKWYFYGWAFCALMAVAHVSLFQNLFMGFSDESGAGYLQGISEGEGDSTAGGFRIDFLLYSAMPVLLGYKIVMKERLSVSPQYLALLQMYLCTNGIWMLCMYAEFTNRIAYLSWFMYPFVLIYPFLKEDLRGVLMLKSSNQYVQFAKVASYHLYFTLFMELVVYKFLK